MLRNVKRYYKGSGLLRAALELMFKEHATYEAFKKISWRLTSLFLRIKSETIPTYLYSLVWTISCPYQWWKPWKPNICPEGAFCVRDPYRHASKNRCVCVWSKMIKFVYFCLNQFLSRFVTIRYKNILSFHAKSIIEGFWNCHVMIRVIDI